MPTTLTGLLLFVVLLLPGFAFLWIYTFDRPARRLTVLQETGAVVVVSVICNLITLGLAAAASVIAPLLRIDIGHLITDPDGYLKSGYPAVAAWFIVSLATACALAAIAGFLARKKPVHPSHASSWWTLFDTWHPDTVRYIQCELDNGTSVAGVLGDWNTMPDDSPDRDLILNAPITFRPAPDAEYQHHPVSSVCVSARRIVAMFVNYSDDPPVPTPSAISCPPSAAAAQEGSSAAEAKVVAPSPHGSDPGHGYDLSRRSPSGSSTPRDRVSDRRGTSAEPIVARKGPR